MKTYSFYLSVFFLLLFQSCTESNDSSKNVYTGELQISGNRVYITDCNSGIKYDLTGNTTELISGAKDLIADGTNQVFATIEADSIAQYTLQHKSIVAYLNQPPASCKYHMGYLSTKADNQWKVTSDNGRYTFTMSGEEWILEADEEAIYFPPVNPRITSEYLEYNTSTLWNDNQSYIRIAIMPRACENPSTSDSYYTVITLDNELIKACSN